MGGRRRPQFVLFGSSIVQFSYSHEGWGSILTDLYSRKVLEALQCKPFNINGMNLDHIEIYILLRGYSGWNSRRALQVLDQVFPKDAAVQPLLVIVYFGGNDALQPRPSGLGPHVPLHEYVENMRKIAIHLMSLSEKTRIIFLTAPPVNEEQIRQALGDKFSSDRTNETLRAYSEACVELCREMNLKVIDLWTKMQQRDDWSSVCFTDGVHFSSEGSKIVAREILKVIKEAHWEPCLHWRFLPTEFAEDSPYDPVSHDGGTLNVSDAELYRNEQWE